MTPKGHAEDGRCCPSVWEVWGTLPNGRHAPIAHPFAILVISWQSWQLVRKQGLFIEQPPREQGGERGKRHQAPAATPGSCPACGEPVLAETMASPRSSGARAGGGPGALRARGGHQRRLLSERQLQLRAGRASFRCRGGSAGA
jgi:hypothetical protein